MSIQTQVIEDFIVKFQARDITSIRPFIHSEFTWFDSSGSVVVQGAEPFLSAIEGMWRDHPEVVNTSSVCIQVGNLVSHTESFRGYSDGHSEDWIWVYEFDGGVILKMYGFRDATE
jgi:hypothetical protein